MDDGRRGALMTYLLAVVRDLGIRGVIRWRTGQSIESILSSEAATVLGEIKSDLAAVGLEMGLGFLGAGKKMLEGIAQQQIESVMQSVSRGLADLLGSNKRR